TLKYCIHFNMFSPISFFFQAEDGIRDGHVTGVQTCALPISELSSCREYDIACQRMPDRVDRLIERVLCPRAGAFRPEVGLDAVARETRFSAQAEDRKQTQRPLLLR